MYAFNTFFGQFELIPFVRVLLFYTCIRFSMVSTGNFPPNEEDGGNKEHQGAAGEWSTGATHTHPLQPPLQHWAPESIRSVGLLSGSAAVGGAAAGVVVWSAV